MGLIAGGALFGALGVVFFIMNPAIRKPIVAGLTAAGVAGLFQELIQLMIQKHNDFRELFFTWDGMTLQGAIILFLYSRPFTACGAGSASG